MRRDRLVLVATLTAIFSADLYFILLPKLQRSVHSCSCGPHNLTLPSQVGFTALQLSNCTSPQLVDGSTSEPVERGSKLERLFNHPLYNIQTPGLAPEERLLQEGQLIEYYKRKVSRWERSVSAVDLGNIFNKI